MNLKTFISASMLVMMGMVAGRLLGMVREMTMAAHFGTGPLGDMAITLLMIPDFITSALIGAAVSSALVPAFAARSPERALALLWQALTVSVAVFGVVVLLLSLKAPWLISQLKAHEDMPELSQALVIALSSIPFSVATAVLTAYLQHKSKFLIPAFATVIFNLVIIATLWFGADNMHLLAIGIFAASFFRFMPHLLAFLRSEATHRPDFKAWELDRKLVKIYVLATGSGLFGLLPTYAPYAVVAAMGDSIALFNYAFKLVLLPSMLTQTVVQLVLLPWLVAQRNNTTANNSGALALQLSWLVALSMAIALMLAAPAIAALFFSYGKMQPEDIMRIGDLFAVGVWALPGMLLATVWQVIFFSHERATPPLISNMLQAIGIIPACWLGHQLAGLQGMLIAFAAMQALCVLLLAIFAYRLKLSQHFLPSLATVKITFVVVLVALPFLLGFHRFMFGDTTSFLLAMLCGMLSLTAGGMVNPVIRQAIKQQLATRRLSHHR